MSKDSESLALEFEMQSSNADEMMGRIELEMDAQDERSVEVGQSRLSVTHTMIQRAKSHLLDVREQIAQIRDKADELRGRDAKFDDKLEPQLHTLNERMRTLTQQVQRVCVYG